MKTPLIAQISFTVLIALAMAFVTFYEWKKVGYLDNPESAAAVKAFDERTLNVPKEIPNWTLVADNKNIDQSQIGAAGITQFLTRFYRNKETGEEVSMFFSTGMTQNIAVHTPAVCYPGQGAVEIDHEAITETIQDKAGKNKFGTFLRQKFQIGGAVQDIWWAFNQEGTWVGAKDARSEFYKPALYKIYLITFPERSKKGEEPIQVRFMRDFIPVSTPVLFPKNDVKVVAEGEGKTPIEPATAKETAK